MQPTYEVVALSQEEENEFNFVDSRNVPKPISFFASVMLLIKGALGCGVISSHVAYKEAGVGVAIPVNILITIYMCYCLQLLCWSAQMLYKRTKVPDMSYSEVGEAAFSCNHSLLAKKFALDFRKIIDVTIMIDLFGSCASYQIIIAKTAKQLIEHSHILAAHYDHYHDHGHGHNHGHDHGQDHGHDHGQGQDHQHDHEHHDLETGYSIRFYLTMFILPIICICLISHLKWLTPLCVIANFFIVVCIGMNVYFAVVRNPRFEHIKVFGSFYGTVKLFAVMIYSMSASGIVLPVENHMRNPKHIFYALYCAMAFNAVAVMMISFFGYVAFLEKSEAPITINFPMTLGSELVKASIVFMVFVTHAVNFWIPFDLVWHYWKKKHKSRFQMWELVYRTIVVALIVLVAIIFPNFTALSGFLGNFCLPNMAIVWPNLIFLLVAWKRPGLGKHRWRLWVSIFFIIFGLIVLFTGTLISIVELKRVFKGLHICDHDHDHL